MPFLASCQNSTLQCLVNCLQPDMYMRYNVELLWLRPTELRFQFTVHRLHGFETTMWIFHYSKYFSLYIILVDFPHQDFQIYYLHHLHSVYTLFNSEAFNTWSTTSAMIGRRSTSFRNSQNDDSGVRIAACWCIVEVLMWPARYFRTW